ncbi:MAG: alpha-galactosidase [Clostridia bacterium]|nr:alpha-galactosidase [Clostridia bacterium]
MILKNGNTFHLQGRSTSYIILINEYGDLIHYHYGKKLADMDYCARIANESRSVMSYDEKGICLEISLLEYPAYGYTDLRSPAYSVKNKYGNSVSRLLYKDYCIIQNEVQQIEGMPCVFSGDKKAQTLEITLRDNIINLEVILSYTVFEEYDIILRSAKFINTADEVMTVETCYSASIDFEKGEYDLVYFPGAWIREREFIRTEIRLGEKLDISNARGGSGHAVNPFVMLCSKDATERKGEVYGFSLIYSGNHSTVVECDIYGNVRVKQGINPFEFEHELRPDETFYTPQSVLCYSDSGFGGLSREMHDVYRNNLCKSKWANMDRPILINNWEATYFDFDEEKLMEIVKKAKALGIELFVLDDGWFGKRNDDKSSLGDWFVNKQKLPSGINGLAKRVNNEGLKFGLWFEPEMVNPDSKLYRTHPAWAISVPDRRPAFGRNQYMLDLSNNDVCDYIIKSLSDILGNANISYVKWDYNRMMTDMPCKGYNHRYTLGLYKVLDALTEKFPDVLFEGCASGGGRFDAGILAYSPQIWTSDNSDAVSRLKIQYSTSMCYPLSTISAHVTASPNHQVGRITPLKTRADVAYAGIFGYELDITQMDAVETEEVKKQIEFYNEIRTLVRTGDFYRLQSPYDGNYCSWQIVAKDKSEFVLFGCRVLALPNTKDAILKLEGLDESLQYTDIDTEEQFGGAELMYRGILPKYKNYDFSTFVRRFKSK